MTITLPRETLEFIPVNITIDGTPVTTGVKVCVTTGTTRPTDWVDPVTVEGNLGVMTSDTHTPDTYKVWVQVTDSPELPVLYLGSYRLT